jgi:DNA-binding NarL/FixJ family response regulator
MGILIAEDNAIQRQYLTQLYETRFPDYGPVESVAEGVGAVEMARRQHPDLIILDIQMPGKNGIQAAQEIWAAEPKARILFWSQFKDEIYLRELGRIVPAETVYGYLLKTANEEQLISAARAVLIDEQCWIDREVRGLTSRAANPTTGLTDAEYEALIDIALGLTDNTIARRRFLSRRGVQNRLSALYTKLGIDQEQEDLEGETASAANASGQTFNPRNRTVLVALLRGLINPTELSREAKALNDWLAANRH